MFQVIPTDGGSEFTDPTRIEADTETGEIQCHVFYCEPLNSNQKSNCERNHEFIRYVIPKGQIYRGRNPRDDESHQFLPTKKMERTGSH